MTTPNRPTDRSRETSKPPQTQPSTSTPFEAIQLLSHNDLKDIPQLSNEISYNAATSTLIVIIDTDLPLRPITPIFAPTQYHLTLSTPRNEPDRASSLRSEERWQTVKFYTKRKLLHVFDVTGKEEKRKVTAWTKFPLPPLEANGSETVKKLMFKFVDVNGKGDVKEVVVDLLKGTATLMDWIVSDIEEELLMERIKLRDEEKKKR